MNKRTFLKTLIAAPIGVKAAAANIRKAAEKIGQHDGWGWTQRNITLKFHKRESDGDEIFWLECSCGAQSNWFRMYNYGLESYAYTDWHEQEPYLSFKHHECIPWK